MKKLILMICVSSVFFCFFLNVINPAPVAAKDDQKTLKLFDDLQKTIISVSDAIKPSVVHIEVVKKTGQIKYKSMASGLVVDREGFILTNDHVVDDAKSVTVTLHSKLEYPAEIIGTDKQTDLALIKIVTEEELFVAKLGNSDEVQVGEWVIAVGNPYGFDRTVSLGIVSGKGRVLAHLPMETQLINDFIQTDAAIDPGSSGGPLVNLRGEVIGINSIGFGRGQGFTIPMNTANDVKDKLLSSGTIQRGWLGVAIQPLSRDYAKYFGDPGREGILIADVIQDSPAQKAGLLPGDVVIEYKGEKMSAEKEDDLNRFQVLVSQTEVGAPARLKIARDGRDTTIVIEISKQPKVKADEFEAEWGITVTEITDAIYRQNMLEDKEGVMVSFVEVGGVASTALLEEGDVIKKVEEFEIKSLDDFKASVEQVKDREQIMLTVMRGKNLRFVLLLPKQEEKGATP
ncbi:MAG: trypsin-like peptidase domain-containing protein [Candidatus Zixiibacteriota bacterium]